MTIESSAANPQGDPLVRVRLVPVEVFGADAEDSMTAARR